MLKRIWMVAVGLLLGAVVQSNAGVVATWNFEGLANNPKSPYAADSVDANSLTAGSDAWGTGQGVSPNNPAGNGSTHAFEFSASNGHGDGFNTTSPGTASPGATFFTLTLSIKPGTALNSFSLTYDAKASGSFNNGGPLNTWYYSLNNGSTWTAVGTTVRVTADGAWHSESLNLGSFTTTGNSILLQDTFSDSTAGNTGTAIMDFDNIQVSAVPEPVNVALAWFGVGVVGVAVVGKLKFRKQKC